MLLYEAHLNLSTLSDVGMGNYRIETVGRGRTENSREKKGENEVVDNIEDGK
jgi:hypothetical protein